MKARYVHTNLVARDWRELAAFYQRVFECTPVPPERDLSGVALESLTALERARIRGMHLRLPGYDDSGPTLEIFEYEPRLEAGLPALNRPGFGHLAFEVSDVPEALELMLAAGGTALGEVSRFTVPGAGQITVVYARDPEGNIIELQSWKR